MFAPYLLGRTDPAIRRLSKTARPAPDAGHSPRIRAATPGRPAPPPPDQWSRPTWRAPGARLKSSMPMPSRSVRPAGNRHSCGDMPPAPPTRYADYLPGCAGLRRDTPGRWRHRRVSARSDKSAGHSVWKRCPERRALSPPYSPGMSSGFVRVCVVRRAGLQGSAETAAACGGYCRVRYAGATAATTGPDARGSAGFPRWERSCPHRGCVRPGRPTVGRERVAGREPRARVQMVQSMG